MSVSKYAEFAQDFWEDQLFELISLLTQILVGNSLTGSLVVLGVICVVLAIVEGIPPMKVEGGKARALGTFGLLLIAVAIGLAWILAASTIASMDTPPSVISTNPASPGPTATTVAAQIAGCNGWCEEIGSVPESGTRVSIDLAAGQLLLLSGGQLLINGKYCGNDANQICVIVFEASKPQAVVVDALIPRNNYIGITDTYDSEEALNIKVSAFWESPNCIDGCSKATVLFFRDGGFVRQQILYP